MKKRPASGNPPTAMDMLPRQSQKDKVSNRVHPNTTKTKNTSKAQKNNAAMPTRGNSLRSHTITHQYVSIHPPLDKWVSKMAATPCSSACPRDKEQSLTQVSPITNQQSGAPGGLQHKKEQVINCSQTKHLQLRRAPNLSRPAHSHDK